MRHTYNNILRHIMMILSFLFSVDIVAQRLSDNKTVKIAEETISNLQKHKLIEVNPKYTIDSIIKNKEDRIFNIFFSKEISYLPIREGWLKEFEDVVRKSQSRRVRHRYKINCYSNTELLHVYIPNIYRKYYEIDSSRMETRKYKLTPNVQNTSNKYVLEQGLQNRHIAIWGGHGLYYNEKDEIWEWQRPNLFTTVEDMLVYSYVVPYIMPMLQNAGANVYYPKERDSQTKEYIIDFDTNKRLIKKTSRVYDTKGGFRLKKNYLGQENPFKLGTHHNMKSKKISGKNDFITYKVPKKVNGKYAVYISYSKSKNVSDVRYDVHHDGGKTSFLVNQKMGFGTWIYLGEFQFGKKRNNKIIVGNLSEEKGIITSDAIKLGGGYNRITRNGTTSSKAMYMNGARYYLQYAGMPYTTVYSLSGGTSDYKDDYKSRGEWVNYLLGKPYSNNIDKSLEGLNIPIDLSISFHTDAGATKTDSIIGTLAIYSTKDVDNCKIFPDGRSRFANRDLADIVQSEITSVIKEKYNEKWDRRSMWDKPYLEAVYPNVPSMLIELLSHQNFEDMKYGLDPNFKFDVSRAIYIGILKFIAFSNNKKYIVAPLAVNSFSINYDNKKLHLSWEATKDEREITATADKYIVYTKVNNGGFDNGVIVDKNECIFSNIKLGEIYSFKIKAINKGGVSFDSEILSASISKYNHKPILIVNAFEKTSAPEYFDTDSLGGFPQWEKSAIANGIEYSFTGNQYNFNKNEGWITNPLTGHGASHSNLDNIRVVGNTFDYPLAHGVFFAKRNLSFVSTSIKAFEKHTHDFLKYDKMDLIYGKQSMYKLNVKNIKYDYSIFRKATRDALDIWMSENKSMLISGAFIAKDVFVDNKKDTIRTSWVKDNINYNIMTDKASADGLIVGGKIYRINIMPSEFNYELRSVDALKRNLGGKVIFRYKENNYPSAIYSRKKGMKFMIFGFPINNVVGDKYGFFKGVIKILDWK